MSDYNQAIYLTLQHEGGFVDNPVDPGGATNMGIEQREWTEGDVRNITVDQAVEFYRERFWKPLYSQIQSQSLANKLFDLGVLFGVGTAVMLLQRALGIASDGIFGDQTLEEVNDAASHPNLLGAFKSQMINHVQQVIQTNPSLYQFRQGWLNRINS